MRAIALSTAAALGLSGVIALAGPAQAGSAWGVVLELSDASYNSEEAMLAGSADDSFRHLLFKEYTGSQFKIRYSSSTDSGSSWSSAVDLSDTTRNAIDPILLSSADGKTVAAAWRWYNGGGGGTNKWVVQARVSADGGQSWGSVATLSDSSQTSYELSGAMSLDGSRVSLVWRWDDGSTDLVQTSTSGDKGVSWSAVTDLSDGSEQAVQPSITVSEDGGSLVAGWHRNDGSTNKTVIQTKTSSDGGGSWSTTAVDLSDNAEDAVQTQLSASADGQDVVATWSRESSGTYVVQASMSDDAGATWSTPTDLSDGVTEALDGQLGSADDASVVHAVWKAYDGSNYVIRVRTSTDKGASWSATQTISATGQNAKQPRIATSVDGSTAVVVWPRFDGSHDVIQAATTEDSASTWSSVNDVSESGQNAYEPQVWSTGSGDSLQAVWGRSNGSKNVIQTAIGTYADAPGAPTGVTATAGVEQATLSWAAPSSDGGAAITGYRIQAHDGSGWDEVVADTGDTDTGDTDTSRTVTGLAAGTGYVFRVAAINPVGTGDNSSSSIAVTPTAPASGGGGSGDGGSGSGGSGDGGSGNGGSGDGGSGSGGSGKAGDTGDALAKPDKLQKFKVKAKQKKSGKVSYQVKFRVPDQSVGAAITEYEWRMKAKNKQKKAGGKTKWGKFSKWYTIDADSMTQKKSKLKSKIKKIKKLRKADPKTRIKVQMRAINELGAGKKATAKLKVPK
ncbi:MAG: fibronectin type III domain-containing protein [Actinomycetia bacterium]|nr:fibronectin type III domain-containing protein [Actinomycetes bacterium]MCH9800046.1 fibronectin type III domain-containing protein [Actinomycetes bacterium]